jgi:hypothetical protein
MRFCGIPNSSRNTKEEYVVENSLGVTGETGSTYLIKQSMPQNFVFWGRYFLKPKKKKQQHQKPGKLFTSIPMFI